MAKKKLQVSMESYGIYSKWDADDKALPTIKAFTTDIPAEIDIEFGFVVRVKKGKGLKLRYCIYHPDIPDEDGEPMPPFDGEIYVRHNDWDFFLGDTIWAPIDNKLGIWRMTLELDGDIIAEKSFDVQYEDNIADFSRFSRYR